MTATRVRLLSVAGMIFFLCALAVNPPAWAAAKKLDNAGCLGCHDSKKAEDRGCRQGRRKADPWPHRCTQVRQEHSCRDAVRRLPHRYYRQPGQARQGQGLPSRPTASIATRVLWEDRQRQTGRPRRKTASAWSSRTSRTTRDSFHARPDKDDPGRPRPPARIATAATTSTCRPGQRAAHRLAQGPSPTPAARKCHEDQLEAYAASVHGEEAARQGQRQERGLHRLPHHPRHRQHLVRHLQARQRQHLRQIATRTN